jgi:hypothetical protein
MSEFVALQNNTDPNVPTSSGQHVLMKDQAKIKRAVRRTTIVVNSRDRNLIHDLNSNTFRYKLRRPLTNVMSIELMNGCIPSYIYNMNTGWNTFSINEGGVIRTITLTPGYYTESSLLTELQNQLNLVVNQIENGNTYAVLLNPTTKKVQITSTNIVPYTLLFYSGSPHDDIDLNTLAISSVNTPARLLGFGLQDYSSNASGSITSVLPIDIDNFLKTIYLHIESDGKNLSRMELGNGGRDCFHIFYLVPGSANYLLLNKETDHALFESSPAPIARMMTLDISFRDEFYRLVDFNQRESTLVFEITHLE